ncbi:MAG: HNH endonuclease domain-containing protein [Limisphaerales bacterium]
MNESRRPSRRNFCRNVLGVGGDLDVGIGEAMAQDSGPNQTPALAGVASRYPEKTFYLGQVFKDTTNSYKLVWFLAILSLIKRSGERSFRLADIFTEMATVAWHPVCLYRLSLGRQDSLQHVVQEIQQTSGLLPNATSEAIRKFVSASADAKAKLRFLKRFVPTLFLTPWFADKLRGQRDEAVRRREITAMATQTQTTPFASLYYFQRDAITLNNSWLSFLAENSGIIQSFAEHNLARYLQARNPNVPGVVNKLRAPTERQLTAARNFWRLVRTDFERAGKSAAFRDIYSDRQLGATFSIDHFLPWSFVVHDLLWNLTPVEPATNSSKNDVLPDLDLYLPRLASLHFAAIKAVKKRPKLLDDYADCFKLDLRGLLALGQDGLEGKYREVIAPQAQIAVNLGFQPGWRMRSDPAELIETAESKPLASTIVARPEPQEDIPSRSVIVQFPEGEPGRNYLPYYSLKIAAGGFIAGDAPEPEGWVNVVKLGFSRHIFKGMFASKVTGNSMAPTIKDGALCVFHNPVVGSRQGRVLLVQRRRISDPETGGNFTVKRYSSTKIVDENGWRHDIIELIPDNPDRQKYPVMQFTPEDDEDLRVIAEFVAMLNLQSEKASEAE